MALPALPLIIGLILVVNPEIKQRFTSLNEFAEYFDKNGIDDIRELYFRKDALVDVASAVGALGARERATTRKTRAAKMARRIFSQADKTEGPSPAPKFEDLEYRGFYSFWQLCNSHNLDPNQAAQKLVYEILRA